jgi:hypothetical protein
MAGPGSLTLNSFWLVAELAVTDTSPPPYSYETAADGMVKSVAFVEVILRE